MNLDGTDERQVTDFGAMSWAPYIHPSGQYVLFASNKLGFENFEVFMVDIDGKKEPVRVTYSDGFDGLPVPSPDGTQLAWTSSRGGGREGQIYPRAVESPAGARGDQERAGAEGARNDRTHVWRSCRLPFCLVAATLPAAAQAPATRRRMSQTLASEKFAGREAGSPGERLAADYIASQLARIGARPLPGRADMFVPFTFTAGSRDGGSRARRRDRRRSTRRRT